MVDDYAIEKLIKNYAKENNYTLVSNSYGKLEYFKYNNSKGSMDSMKWYRGAKDIIMTASGKIEKIMIDDLMS